MLKRFPNIPLDDQNVDANPAIRLFGRRFFSDQTTLELLIELLLIATSVKKLEEEKEKFDSILPPPSKIKISWTGELKYATHARLNLKLFSFFGASKLDTRHETHRKHLEHLDLQLKNRMSVSDDTPENVLTTLENLFLGFHGVGMQRTWCAQSFMPISKSMLASETIWNESFALRNPPDSWDSIVKQYATYFAVNKHRFLARGGEVLYLQLCNALRRDPNEIKEWLQEKNLDSLLTSNEKDPAWLHSELERALNELLKETPNTVSKIAEFIDCGDDDDTPKKTDGDKDNLRWTSCGWCPEETWPESYLYAVELLRICRANLDLMDRLELLETLCALQVMRTLAMQAARYAPKDDYLKWPAYRLAISDPDGEQQTVKQVSRATLQAVSKTIYDGLRNKEILDRTPSSMREKLYAEADRRYGHKLFVTLGKRIGMIVPRRGSGMRFVLNGRILRLLVVALSSERRITYETFKRAAEAHFGLAFDEDALGRANAWATGVTIQSFGSATDEWLAKMLEEAGVLRRLSDSCALIENSAAPGK